MLRKHETIDRRTGSPTLCNRPVFTVLLKKAERACVNGMFHAFFRCCHQQVISAARLIIDSVIVGLVSFGKELRGYLSDVDNGIHAAHQLVG